MCRMIAFASPAVRPIGPALRALAHQSKCGVNAPHAHGYGLALWRDDHWLIIREQCAVWDAPLDDLGSLQATLAILHSRKASDTGTINFTKLHPFCALVRGDSLVFCQNGTIDGHERIASRCGPGAIDTEKYADLFYQAYESHGELGGALRDAAHAVIASGADPTSLNAFASNGRALAAYRGPVKDPSYHTLYSTTGGGATIVSTETFDLPQPSLWQALDGLLETTPPSS